MAIKRYEDPCGDEMFPVLTASMSIPWPWYCSYSFARSPHGGKRTKGYMGSLCIISYNHIWSCNDLKIKSLNKPKNVSVSFYFVFFSSAKKCYLAGLLERGWETLSSISGSRLPQGEAVHPRQSRLTSLAEQAKSNLNDSPRTYGNHYLISRLVTR